MIGPAISNIRLALAIAAGLAGAARADELTLAGGKARLSGSVRSISATGAVELETALSPEPLLLQPEAVGKIVFSRQSEPAEAASCLVGLANGDLLPARLEGFDGRQLTVVSPDAGRLAIPREALRSLQTGIQRRKVIFTGPNNLEEWNGGEEGTKNWTFSEGALVSGGSATAARKLALPRQFILRATLEWEDGQVPNFQVSFADPLVAKGEPCDRYYLQFGAAGLELKRESTQGRRYNTIVALNRSFREYANQQLAVELLVNRDTSRLHLSLNGEPEGEFVDPIANAPDGNGIAIVANTPQGRTQKVRAIEVLECDDSRGRHRSEDRGDPQHDSLISREDDRWSGQLLGIRQTAQGPVFQFKAGFQEQAMEIPEKDVSTVFFSAKDEAAKDEAPPPVLVRTTGDGTLRVAACRFDAGSITTTHPLLGPLTLRREGILSIERPSPEPSATPKP